MRANRVLAPHDPKLNEIRWLIGADPGDVSLGAGTTLSRRGRVRRPARPTTHGINKTGTKDDGRGAHHAKCELSRSEENVAMLKLIEGSYASFFPREMDAMFRDRARTFSGRLGWEVSVKDGYERDAFDDANPLYLVSVDPDTEQYCGSLRLLPTTGPNMLRDVFPFLLGEGDFIESATIWEASRICAVAAVGYPERGKNGVGLTLGELLAGIGEVAIIARLIQIVSVFDARIYRILRAAGCDPQIIGRPRRIGGTMSYAGLFDVGEGLLQALRKRLGIEGSVLAPDVQELAGWHPHAGSSGKRTGANKKQDSGKAGGRETSPINI
jgi:N-acyl-L-homoserine lactone synthetase